MIDKLHNLLNETRIEWKCLESVLSEKKAFRDEVGVMHTQIPSIQQGIASTELEIKMHKKAYLEQLTELLKLAEDVQG